MQLIQFADRDSAQNSLYDTRLQSTPVQVTDAPWTAQGEAGSVLCLGLSYDGTCLLSGHASGRIVQWDIGRRCFAADLADLNAPVTNLLMLSPFPKKRLTKAATIVKPKLGEGNYVFTAQLTSATGEGNFRRAVTAPGFPSAMLERAITSLSAAPSTGSSPSGDAELRKENEELWKIVNEQRALQMKTWSKIKTGGV